MMQIFTPAAVQVRFVELQRRDAERHLTEMKSALPAKPSRNTDVTPAPSFQRSFHNQNVREAPLSDSMRGGYTSAYELHDHSARDPPRMHPALSQVPYGSASRAPYSSASGQPAYEGSRLIFGHVPPQTYPTGQVNVPSRGGYQESAPIADHYARESSFYPYHDDHGVSSYPYEVPPQGTLSQKVTVEGLEHP